MYCFHTPCSSNAKHIYEVRIHGSLVRIGVEARIGVRGCREYPFDVFTGTTGSARVLFAPELWHFRSSYKLHLKADLNTKLRTILPEYVPILDGYV